MIVHSALTKRKLFAELRERIEKRQRCPSLAWIAKFARLESEDEALSLLKALDDDAVIKILRDGPYPWISVIRNTYVGAKVAGMTLDAERFDRFREGKALVVKSARDVVVPKGTRSDGDEGVALAEDTVAAMREPARLAKNKIAAAATPQADVAKGAVEPRAVTPAPAPDPVEIAVEVVIVSTPIEADAAAAMVSEVEALPAPEPQPVEARQPTWRCGHDRTDANTKKRARGDRCRICETAYMREWRGRARTRMLQFNAPVDVQERLKELAERDGVSMTEVVVSLVRRSLDAPTLKPRIPAAIMVAHAADGRPFNQFCTDIMALGLEAHIAFRDAA